MNRWIVLLIALAATACHRRSVDAHADARAERQTPVAAVAPAPVPTALPLVGPDGVDSDGYSLKLVDRAALRSLLYHREFDALTTYMETRQSGFEGNTKNEYWAFDAASAFDTAEAICSMGCASRRRTPSRDALRRVRCRGFSRSE